MMWEIVSRLGCIIIVSYADPRLIAASLATIRREDFSIFIQQTHFDELEKKLRY